MGLKIMHLWNTAGVGGLIARYMDRMMGTQSQSYMWDRWDPFGFGTEKTINYKTILGNRFGKLKVPTLVRTARHYDIIHNHGLDGLIPWLKFIYPRKKIILHYHGTRIRGKWDQKKHLWRWADHILVSTPDLLEGAPVGAFYIPNLMDWDVIDELKSQRNERDPRAFTVSRWTDYEAEEIARSHGLDLTIHDRVAAPLSHRVFLEKLSQFTHYIDIKRDFYSVPGSDIVLRAHSLTGLEAMGLGLTVYNWLGEESEHDIENHRPENVIPLLWELYNSSQ